MTTTSRSEHHPMLACGHAANGVCTAKGGIKYDPPIPCCTICSCTEVSLAPPDLTGRTARCCSQATDKPSSTDLAFFEYRGPGSKVALNTCVHCGYFLVAHENKHKQTERGRRNNHVCDNFKPHGAYDTDRYYCGHSGWD